jgi:hypothetical protein
MEQIDLFGDRRISIPDNPALQRVAEMILNLLPNYPEMIEGDTIGEVDRKIREIVWLENGLYKILTSDDSGEDRVKEWEKWNSNPQQCVDAETLRRARQKLVADGIIKLKKSAILQGERERARISKSFGRK